jgi:dihydrofolate synthase/folylpolyglutamate synthase
VYTPRERVQFGRELISEADLADFTEKLMARAETLSETEFGGATEFEFKTALGFKYWKEKKCEWVALEVGLGGRLDATNVVTPKASVIASIGLDHTSILGSTIVEIAGEKAGIVKPGAPVIVGQMHHEARTVIERVAAEQGSPIWRFGHEVDLVETGDGYRVQTPNTVYEHLHPGIKGVKQPHNMALAIAALDAAGAIVDPQAVADGAGLAGLPGRLERRSVQDREVLLDGAHNRDASLVLRENLDQFFAGRRVILVAGMVGGHDPAHFFEPLKGRIKSAFAVPIDFHRSLGAAEVACAIKSVTHQVETCEKVEDGLRAALNDAGEDDLVLVTGSFYLVGEAGKILGSW